MGSKVTFTIAFVSVLLLGTTAGAMLAEAAVLVPYWQSLSAPEFFDWYGSHATLLVDFYSPLEVGSAVGALTSAILCSARSRPEARAWWVAAVLSLLVIGMFFVFFKEANAEFAERSVPEAELSAVLGTWARWQWGRVAIGIAAFAAAIVAVRRGAAPP
ncbi:MAG: anthrone oxygenase family protein [Myxococcota bacterium]